MAFLDNLRNFTTTAISVFSPKAAFRRQQYFAAMNALRAYEGASRGRRTEGWKTQSSSANEETRSGLTLLRDRSRDLFRNNPYAFRAIIGLADNIVGTGIRPTPANVGSKASDKKIKKLWADWANKVSCDWDGKNNLYGLQHLACKTLMESGEVLIVRRRLNDPSMAIPMQLQVIEPDYIDTTREFRATKPGEPEIIQGIQYDKNGKRIGYWLYDRHPGDGWFNQSKFVSNTDVIHIYPVMRPGQVRGVPQGSASIIKMRDFDEYEDAQLIKQKIAACFGAFVTDDAEAAVAGDKTTESGFDRMEPGMIEYLPTGKQVTFATPPSTDGYDVYTRTVLRAIAAGYGVTYEMMSGDLSNVNFSSGRMGWIEMQRLFSRFQELVLVPQMCTPIWDWFMDAAVVSMQIRPTQVVDASWTAPRREMIDPVKETQGMKDMVRAGFSSWQEVVRQNGYDPEDVKAEIAADLAAFKTIGVQFEWNPEVQVKAASPANDGKPPKQQDANA